jgi:hypothetical protein
MASTYVNDLRLNEMATGDASGTWGTVTNTNLELIGEALGFGTEAITTNADTHTTTVADGATDPGRAMYLKYTGTLDSACTITIAPNTMSRMQFIENGTSGSQNIIISQGSGANITIPAGDTKAVYLDGAGSGAAVVDAFASLSTVDLKVQDDLTVTDDATIGGTLGVTGIVTLTDDLIIGDGKTIGSASDVDAMTIASNGQITLTQTLIGTALDISGDIDVDGTSNLDVVDIDGAVDMASTLQVDGAITSSSDLTLTSAGPAISLVDSDNNPDYQIKNGNGSLRFIDTTNTVDLATFTAGEVAINEGSADVDFRVESNGDGHMLFVDAGNDKVGVGVSAPSATLDVRNSSGTDAEAFISVGNSDGSKFLGLYSGRLNNALPTIFADSTSTRIRFAFADDNVFGSGFAEEMALFPNGKLGIGSSPTNLTDEVISISTPASGGGHGISFKRLDTNTDQVCGQIRWSNNSTDDLAFIKAKTDGANTASALQFFTNGGSGVTEKARFNKTGRLLGFTTTNQEPGDTPTDENSYILGPGYLFLNRDDTAEVDQITFGKDGNTRGRVVTTTATSYVTTSDYRQKENVDYTWDATSRLKQLKPARYNWIEDETNTLEDGFLAHEVSSIVPHAVFGEKDGDVMQGMDYAKITPLLTKALQELEARVTTLEG